MTDTKPSQAEIAAKMRAQREAWEQFQTDHPIAARKAKQKAEAEARKHTRVSLSFGTLTMTGRE